MIVDNQPRKQAKRNSQRDSSRGLQRRLQALDRPQILAEHDDIAMLDCVSTPCHFLPFATLKGTHRTHRNHTSKSHIVDDHTSKSHIVGFRHIGHHPDLFPTIGGAKFLVQCLSLKTWRARINVAYRRWGCRGKPLPSQRYLPHDPCSATRSTARVVDPSATHPHALTPSGKFILVSGIYAYAGLHLIVRHIPVLMRGQNHNYFHFLTLSSRNQLGRLCKQCCPP
eukprot:1185524-Prorocentrum_minimum.AAC.3